MYDPLNGNSLPSLERYKSEGRIHSELCKERKDSQCKAQNQMLPFDAVMHHNTTQHNSSDNEYNSLLIYNTGTIEHLAPLVQGWYYSYKQIYSIFYKELQITFSVSVNAGWFHLEIILCPCGFRLRAIRLHPHRLLSTKQQCIETLDRWYISTFPQIINSWWEPAISFEIQFSWFLYESFKYGKS